MKSSVTGYKKSSKDKKEPALKIPSSRITMKDVPHPVLAILDDGSQHIMYPEQEYDFRNKTNSVIEIPLRMKTKKQQKGKKPKELNQFQFYLSSLKENQQDELLDYMDSLSLEDQMKFLNGGKAMWKKYQSGGTTLVTQFDYQTRGDSMNPKNQKESSGRDILKRGSKGEEVIILQYFLKNKGYYTGEVDGIYGPKTERAVKQYQKWFNKNAKYSHIYLKEDGSVESIGGVSGKKILEDGIVGDQTRSALMYREMPEIKKPVKKIVPVEPAELIINRNYSTTDNIANAGPVVMDYFGGAAMAAMAASPWLMELIPAASGSGATNVLGQTSRNILNQLPKGFRTFPKGSTSPGNPGARVFSPKTPSSYGTQISFQDGGLMQIPAEVEGEETVKLPNGNLYEFDGPKHAQGGIDVVLEAGSKIFSEHLKAPKEVIKAVLGKDTKKKYSYADLSRKFDTTKWSKILQDESSDPYQIETAKLKLATNNAMLETIFEAQESVKNKNKPVSKSPDIFQNGGNLSGKAIQDFWDYFPDIANVPKNSTGYLRTLEPNEYRRKSELKGYYPDNYTLDSTPFKDVFYDPNKKMYAKRSSPTGLYFPIEFPEGQQILPEASTTLDIVEPNRSNSSNKPRTSTNKPKSGQNTIPQQPTDTTPRERMLPLDPLSSTPIQNRQVVSTSGVPSLADFLVNTDVTQPEEQTAARKPFEFGISSKLAGTVLDVGLAMSDKLNVRNPQYRDLRKTPLFSRFVDFEDKEAGRNYALAIKQIQNSNQPQSVKNAMISNLNAQYQDYQAKVDFSQNQAYQNKITTDTEKLQQYLNANIDQHHQDIERYNEQKARVDYLRDQFNAQRKSRVVNSIRGYLDYVDEVNMKNQLLSDNYKLNPFTGKIQFKGEKKDPFAQYEQELNQYAQNTTPVKTLPGGAQFTMLGPGIGLVVDANGETKLVEFKK